MPNFQPVTHLGGTCIYFGTFNPVHTGHLMIAEAALHQYSLALGFKTVTFIPAGAPPHRLEQLDLLEASHRFNMVKLVTLAHPAFRISDIEFQRPTCSYTIDTLRRLIANGTVQPPVACIIGSDALAGLSSWKEPEALVEAVHFLQAPRPHALPLTEIQLAGKTMKLKTSLIDMPPLSLSASWIRAQLQRFNPEGFESDCQETSLRYFLPEPVRRYIQDNNLYAPIAGITKDHP